MIALEKAFDITEFYLKLSFLTVTYTLHIANNIITFSFMPVEYQTTEGTRRSKLLTSGWWGTARHINYTFELLLALCWNLPGIYISLWPLLYNLFLAVLLTHRLWRDEEKCLNKYGKGWRAYCEVVPYRLIPGIC